MIREVVQTCQSTEHHSRVLQILLDERHDDGEQSVVQNDLSTELCSSPPSLSPTQRRESRQQRQTQLLRVDGRVGQVEEFPQRDHAVACVEPFPGLVVATEEDEEIQCGDERVGVHGQELNHRHHQRQQVVRTQFLQDALQRRAILRVREGGEREEEHESDAQKPRLAVALEDDANGGDDSHVQ